MYKIIGADGKEYGPITLEQLRQWMAQGRVNLQTQILPDGASQWITVAELPEFAAAPPEPLPGILSAAGIPTSGPASMDVVNGPAVGLMCVAALGFLLHAGGLAGGLFGHRGFAYGQTPAWVRTVSSPGSARGLAVIGLLMSVLVLIGALKMKRLENYGLAMAASIVAMLPCISPCCIIGLPIGIWALVVLSKPEVKSAFH